MRVNTNNKINIIWDQNDSIKRMELEATVYLNSGLELHAFYAVILAFIWRRVSMKRLGFKARVLINAEGVY